MHPLETFLHGYRDYAGYLLSEITFAYSYKPWYENYFWGLVLVSLAFFSIEYARPWRREQPRFRREFWVDILYLFFNYFLFSLVVFNAASSVVVEAFNYVLLHGFGVTNMVAISLARLPFWAVLLVGFIVRDFVQWWIHRLLHRVPWLWEFHKLHHSTKEMGFAAHLRYHWAETVVYRTLEYIPLALLGIGLYDFFLIHLFTLVVGHFNHSNIKVPLGVLGYVFNNPQMHTWHHAKYLPSNVAPYGANFGLTLSVWDYLFGTVYMPYDGRDIELGFVGEETFPVGFVAQELYPFVPTSRAEVRQLE